MRTLLQQTRNYPELNELNIILNKHTLYRSQHKDVGLHMLGALFQREVFLCFVLLLSRIKLSLETLNCTNYNILGNILRNDWFLPMHNWPFDVLYSIEFLLSFQIKR